MPHVGVQRLPPGDRQDDGAEQQEALPAVLEQHSDGMLRSQGPEHLRETGDLDSSKNNLNTSCCDKLLAGAQAVVPFTMKLVPLEGQFSKLFVRHLEPS